MDMERSSWITSANRKTKPVLIITRACAGEISQIKEMNIEPGLLGLVIHLSPILIYYLSV